MKNISSNVLHIYQKLNTTIFSIAFCLIFSSTSVKSQIVPDDSLNTQVDRNNNTIKITGGEIRGNKLFHSFSSFSLSAENEAFFDNATNIQSIFGRVTGSDISNINGSIGANGSADLYLINPNGIIFSENARLNIGGSFFASTAETINFSNGQFNATTKNNPSVQIGFPIGLGMGSNPGDIDIDGVQNNLVVKIPSFEVGIPAAAGTKELPPGIRVGRQQNITLVGGNINFNGGGLKAPGGNIELLSAAKNTNIRFLFEDNWIKFQPNPINLQNILLKNGAYIDVGDETAGNIILTGREIVVGDGSVVFANTERHSDNSIDVSATDLVRLEGNRGENIESGFYSVSLIGADITSGTAGESGNDININTKNLEIADGGLIRAVNFSNSNSSTGNIVIDAKQIELSGTNEIDGLTASTITTTNGIDSVGNSGDINITTQLLRVKDGARIKADVFGSGQGGLLNIDAQSIELTGNNPFTNSFSTGLITAISPDGDENSTSGNIAIKTERLDILGGAKINSSAFGRGKPGNIIIDAREINIVGFSNLPSKSPSGIIAATNPRNDAFDSNNAAKAGEIRINTDLLRVKEGARIEADTTAGNAGDIFIRAKDIELNGTRPRVGSFIGGISSITRGNSTGDGGEINIDTDSLQILNGSIVRAISLSEGDAGNINIDAKSIRISGVDRYAEVPVQPQRVSKINSGAQRANGGNVVLYSNLIEVDDQARIEASTNEEGIGGNVFIDSDSIILKDLGQIVANTIDGLGGNINISSDAILGINNSDITANAIGGNGGNITIESDYIFGLSQKTELTPSSDITASSEFGLNGDISLTLPNTLTGEEVVSTRPIDFNAADELIGTSCFYSNNNNSGSIANRGQGGLVENPENYFDGEPIVGESTSSSSPEDRDLIEWKPGNPLIEANAVKTMSNGEQYLVARIKEKAVEENICQYKQF